MPGFSQAVALAAGRAGGRTAAAVRPWAPLWARGHRCARQGPDQRAVPARRRRISAHAGCGRAWPRPRGDSRRRARASGLRGRCRLGRRFRDHIARGIRGHMFRALFLEDLLHAPDRQPVLVQQLANAVQQGHIVGPVVTPPARPFHGLHLGKPPFPKAQDMGRSIQLRRNLADRAKRFGGLFYHFISALPLVPGSNAILHQVRWPKGQDAARADRHFVAGLWIATHARGLFAQREGAEG